MRWKAFFYLHPEIKCDSTETVGFKTRRVPHQYHYYKALKISSNS
jgi:hypothetical protein